MIKRILCYSSNTNKFDILRLKIGEQRRLCQCLYSVISEKNFRIPIDTELILLYNIFVCISTEYFWKDVKSNGNRQYG